MKIEDIKKVKGMQICFRSITKTESRTILTGFSGNDYFQTSMKKVLPLSKKIIRFK